ncbi:HEPN domain-containing protein [Pseudomonas sp. KNUC1026]|uniref:HEPN domain-containing protein n=1 Tax=Pseudomonas sp. KNUC1026 TaxID=2893890 RepID=UPI001EEB65AC|nr:HEPN domain-containing protein [Pseudomonas sp. KNUC1026]UFH49595.1 hypothetical protein LN139_22880 [Pseudomonas sp. KNUC1026]
MQILTNGSPTYILLNGIIAHEEVLLDDNICLQPADTSHLDFDTAIKTCRRPDDIAVIAAYIPRITAQLKITANTKEELTARAWNSIWDVLILSAIFHTEVGFNIQSDTTASKINKDSHLNSTSLHMRGLNSEKPYKLSTEDLSWIKTHFADARKLLDDDRFQTAIHCLASYRWHSMPRIKLAILWAGIEGIFGASSEIRFRLSLYIARFLHHEDQIKCKDTFETIKKLYNIRSAAVHGAKIKSNTVSAVDESAKILRLVLLQCITCQALPNENDLVP